MSESFRVDTVRMETAGSSLQAAASQLPWTVPDSAGGCGSQAVENVVQEFAMRMALELRGASEEIEALGRHAGEAARAVEEADQALAQAAP